MNILIITNLYEPYARGGAEAVVKTIAKGLRAQGHDVAVLTAGPVRYGFWPRVDEVDGVRILRFSPWNLYFVRNDFRFPTFIRACARMFEMVSPHPGMVVRAVLKHEKPDVVMTHNLVGIGMRVAGVLKKAGVRHIHTLHDVQLVHPSGLLLWGAEARAEQSLLRRWYENRMKKMWGSPDVVVAPSQWLLDLHTSRGFFPNSKTIVLPNPIDCQCYQRSASTLPTTSYLLPTRLLYAGQLESHKGVAWFLSEYLGFRMKDVSIVIEFAGTGTLEKELKKAAKKYPDKIIFHGKLDQTALFKKFIEVDALVVPSLCYENMPRVISEALCAGLPVIASSIGGISEMIREGENGFLFTPGDAEEFKQAISKLKEKKLTLELVKGLSTKTSQYLDMLLRLV